MELTLIVLISLIFLKSGTCVNDFPSLMVANATMIIVIEKQFFVRKVVTKESPSLTMEAYEKSVASFSSLATRVARERMNISGLSIHLSQDTGINLKQDYTILLSVTTCQVAWELFKRARAEKLVHLAITDLDCPRLPINEAITVPLIDPGEELPQIFFDMRLEESLDWNRVNFIHDGNQPISKVIQVFSSDFPKKLGLACQSLSGFTRGRSEVATRRSIRDLLTKFSSRRAQDQKFLVIVGHKFVSWIIEVARSLGLLHPRSQWLFVIPDMADYNKGNVSYLLDYLEEGENLAFLYNSTKKNATQCSARAFCHARELVGALAVTLEKILNQELKLYESVTEEEYEASGINKLVRSRNIINFMRNELYNESRSHGRRSSCSSCLAWSLDSAITWGSRLMSKNKKPSFKLEKTGFWTSDPGFEALGLIFPHIKFGFLGKELEIATYHNPPWQFQILETDDHFNTKSHWDGLMINILNEISKNLNFTIKYLVIEVPAETMLAKTTSAMSAADKVPAELTNLVKTSKVMMAGCSFATSMYVNEKNINFTRVITSQSYGILAPRPKAMTRTLLFTSPFSNEAWACLASSIVLVGPALYFVHALSPHKADEQTRNPDSTEMLGLGSPSRCIWYIYGALLQQGGMHLPSTDGARLIVGTWWLVVMIIVATYSGTLVAFLTFPRMDPAVNTVDDLLARREEFTWSIPAGSLLENFLEISEYQQLLPEFDGHASFHETASYNDNVDKVKGRGHVMIDWTTALRISQRNQQINFGTCFFSIGTNVLELVEPIALAVPKGSPYLGIIDHQLQRMQESGLINKWLEDWLPNPSDECSDDKMEKQETSNHQVDFYDMQGIFFVLFIGYLTGSIALLSEFYQQHRKLNKERKLIRPFLE
ncbi:GSCOCT00009718001.3-RA-CDS [Cotesia congregata]|uniref:Ionotropic receptor 93a n=1 Tax=Cotesia congregata TaxID=51543 RepID=A0A8J2H276_COTCN|nr:GSCOCT00009718001.3-RA-CDS [Cotesia congregata]CAG5074921.1 Ionotropic receptor 93a [Cotesia congregata]